MPPDIREIAVMYFPEGWRIVAGRHRWGRYAFRVDAEEAALKLALRARRQGHEVTVLVQERHGEMRRLSAA